MEPGRKVVTWTDLLEWHRSRVRALHALGEATDDDVKAWDNARVVDDPERPGGKCIELPSVFRGFSAKIEFKL